MRQLIKTLAATATLALGSTAAAAPIVLDFEGIGSRASVDGFYNGGTDSQGNSGTNHGISFSGNSVALVDSDAGGSGNFANEPSADTILFFTSGTAATVNIAAGFETGFSFFYSSSQAAFVNVYSGLDGTGDLLASIVLDAQFDENCVGDPSGSFCNWTSIGVTFAGMAMSIDFGGTADRVAFDNVTFGSDVAGGDAVPVPAAILLFPAGLVALRAARGKKKALSIG